VAIASPGAGGSSADRVEELAIDPGLVPIFAEGSRDQVSGDGSVASGLGLDVVGPSDPGGTLGLDPGRDRSLDRVVVDGCGPLLSVDQRRRRGDPCQRGRVGLACSVVWGGGRGRLVALGPHHLIGRVDDGDPLELLGIVRDEATRENFGGLVVGVRS
jgi:hypothetical protein